MSTTPEAPPPVAAPGDDNALPAIRARGVAFANDFKPKERAAELARRHCHLDNAALEPRWINRRAGSTIFANSPVSRTKT